MLFRSGGSGEMSYHRGSGTSVHAARSTSAYAHAVTRRMHTAKMTPIACSNISIRSIVFVTDGNIGRETSIKEIREHSPGKARSGRPYAGRTGGKGIVASDLRFRTGAGMQRARLSCAAPDHSSAPRKRGGAARHIGTLLKSR